MIFQYLLMKATNFKALLIQSNHPNKREIKDDDYEHTFILGID